MCHCIFVCALTKLPNQASFSGCLAPQGKGTYYSKTLLNRKRKLEAYYCLVATEGTNSVWYTQDTEVTILQTAAIQAKAVHGGSGPDLERQCCSVQTILPFACR